MRRFPSGSVSMFSGLISRCTNTRRYGPEPGPSASLSNLTIRSTGNGRRGATGNLTEKEFTLLRGLIHQKAGIHLSEAKKPLLVGRLSRRLRELGLPPESLDHCRLPGEVGMQHLEGDLPFQMEVSAPVDPAVTAGPQ